MSSVPVIIDGVFMPSGRSGRDQPMKGTMVGWATIAGLTVGGGPIIPAPTPPGEPTHPIVLPPETPVDPPVDPPEQPPANVAVVIKPAPVTGGWGLAADPSSKKLQWFFTPGESGAGPKHR